MAERDRFELDLAAALRAYALDAPTEVRPTELAQQFAAAYPHGRTALGPWRPVAVPRVAWLLLLLAGLLAAMVAGMLVAGSQMQRKLPAVVPPFGPAFACPPGSRPDTPGPVDQARPGVFNHLDLYTHMAFDRHAGRLLVLAPAAGTPNDVETWTFDVCTNTWAPMNPDQEPSGFAGAKLIYDVDSGVTIALEFNQLRTVAYDLEANTWTEKSFAPDVAGYDARPGWTRSSDLARLTYDAVSGLVVDWNYAGGLWGYDVETDAWTSIRQSNPPAIRISGSLFAYDTSVDRVIAYADTGEPGGAATWLFDIRTGAWSKSGAVTPDFGSDPAIAYDEASERTVIVGGGRSAAYDATADRWETLFEGSASGNQPAGCAARPECRQGHQMVYDSVNDRLVLYGGGVPAAAVEDWVYPDDVLAFDLETREWTVLLAPTDGGAAPTDCGSGPVVSVRPGSAPDRAQPSTGPDRSPWIPAAKVTLHGGPFFTRVAGVADEPWSSTPPADPATVVDGLFLPECQLWTEGTVWWEGATSDPSSRAWIEIDLGDTFVLDAAVVQADVNDEYRLSFRDPETAEWTRLWDVPLGEAGGMATRPDQGDASVRWPLARPVVTDALRLEETSGDAQYSVSEIAVFGVPAP